MTAYEEKTKPTSDQRIVHQSNIRTSTDHRILPKKVQTPIKIYFIDFKAAFESVHRESLWNILILYGMSVKIVSINETHMKRPSVVYRFIVKKKRNGTK